MNLTYLFAAKHSKLNPFRSLATFPFAQCFYELAKQCPASFCYIKIESLLSVTISAEIASCGQMFEPQVLIAFITKLTSGFAHFNIELLIYVLMIQV